VFVGVFAVMAVLVVGITMSVVKPGPRTAGGLAASSEAVPMDRGNTGGPAPGAGPDQYAPAGRGTQGYASQGSGGTGYHGTGYHGTGYHGTGYHGAKLVPQRVLDTRLTAALRSASALCPGELSVAVRDRTTGTEALSEASQSYPAVSTVAADILAVLLYQRQLPAEPLGGAHEPGTPLRGAQSSTPLTSPLLGLAVRMIDDGSRTATARLWRLIGGARGFDAGAAALRLPRTHAPAAGGWRQATTTAAGQLQLLADLTSAASPLTPAARAAAVGLMTAARPGRRTWAAAAASPGTSYAASGGWHAGLTGGIAIVRDGGQRLAIVVLAQGCASWADGMAIARTAARAAAAMITAAPPARASRAQPS
jgi:Beta-lactamase enzyme family